MTAATRAGQPAPSLSTAKGAIEAGAYFTSDELSEILTGGPSHHYIARLRQQGSILGLRFVRRGYLHPAFQFDQDAQRVDPTVAKANKLLTSRMSAADAVLWWFEPGGEDGAVPISLLHEGERRLVVERASRQADGLRLTRR
jgi:hypothetical protein